MTTEEKIAVMQAFCEDKAIEYYDEDLKIWLDVVSPCWNWEKWEYRIKQEPKYIPFDFSDAESLIGKVVKTKEAYFIGLITYVSKTTIVISDMRTNFERLFKDCEFLDGSICGKLKQ